VEAGGAESVAGVETVGGESAGGVGVRSASVFLE
jgi:hypothetical protein